MTHVSSSTARVPLSAQIRDDLAGMIRRQELAPGAKLPPLRQLARDYGVSLQTAAHGIEMLKAESLVVTRPNVGVFVAQPTETTVSTELILCIHPEWLVRRQVLWLGWERLDGMMHAARQRNVRLVPVTRDAEFRERLNPDARQALILFEACYEADGFGPAAEYAVEHGMEICVVMGPPGRFPTVKRNRDKGFEAATAHLLSLGHGRVALLNMPTEANGAPVAVACMIRRGYGRALRRAGMDAGADLYVEATTPEVGGREPTLRAVELLLTRSPRPTAILCNNDNRALVVLDALRLRGLRVPEDISVVGYDDSLESRRSDPPLTSVNTQLSGQGEAVVHYLVDRLHGRRATVPSVTPRLVVRESSGAPGPAPARSREGGGAPG